MSIDLLRGGIRGWLEAQTRIDAWDLDIPANVPTVISGTRYPANCAVEMPIKDLSIEWKNSYCEASGRFNYLLLYRFSGKAAKHQLPVQSAEILVGYLCERAARGPCDIWEDILRLQVIQVADPVTIARVEGEDKDWLIICQIEFEITFLSNAELDGLDGVLSPLPSTSPTPPIVEVRAGLNRSYTPVTQLVGTYTLDQNLTINLP